MKPSSILTSLGIAAVLLLAAGCIEGQLGLPDSDGDGLADSWEESSGLDPSDPDSDGDGWADGEEVYGFADPLDRYDHPYLGLWPRGPVPHDLESTGQDVGDIAEDFFLKRSGRVGLLDQFGEQVSLWSFYGQVVLVEIAAEW